MMPATNFETVVFQMEETDEIAQIYNKHRLPSLSGLSKVSAFIHRADIGGVLNVSELNLIKRLIQVQNQFKTFYNQLVEEDEGVKYPILDDKMNQLPVLTDLFQQINMIIYDNASYKIRSISTNYYFIRKIRYAIVTIISKNIDNQLYNNIDIIIK